jgi:hypothetical protein
MSPLFIRMIITFVIVAFTMGMTALVFSRAYPDVWRRHGRRVGYGTLAALAGFGFLWQAGRKNGLYGVAMVGDVGVSIIVVTCIALFVTMILWGPLGVWLARSTTRAAAAPGTSSPTADSRRAFMRKAVAVIPVGAAMTGPVGTVASLSRPVIREVEVRSRTVPKALDGLTILQLSDVHLGTFIDVSQIQAVVDDVRARKPDLIALTGDIADDYALLPKALAMLHTLEAPLGMYGSIGNHEIYRGRDDAVRIWGENGVQYLCNEGRTLEHKGERFWLAGADDPQSLGEEHAPFLKKSVDKAMGACPEDVTCRVLLSHRPEGFDAAVLHKTTLTLSGHTHGAQMAFLGRSVLEWALPRSYLLGRYHRDDSTLYTTAGLGHWLPFRLNCPCEATLVTLRAA